MLLPSLIVVVNYRYLNFSAVNDIEIITFLS